MLFTDNAFAKFGTYQAGLDFFMRSANKVGRYGVIFANDTIWKKSLNDAVALTFLGFAFSNKFADPFILGQRDSYGTEKFSVGGLELNEWISTHLFLVSEPLMVAMQYQICFDIMGPLENRQSGVDQTEAELKRSFFYDVDVYLADKLDS